MAKEKSKKKKKNALFTMAEKIVLIGSFGSQLLFFILCLT